jgi:hypothetical protein
MGSWRFTGCFWEKVSAYGDFTGCTGEKFLGEIPSSSVCNSATARCYWQTDFVVITVKPIKFPQGLRRQIKQY